ncbi:MAG: VirB8/TrbF family protein [Halothiobacillaceae bacterium]
MNKQSKPADDLSAKDSMNPYIAARREWNERYGDYVAQAKNWRIAALLSGITAAVAVAGVVYIGAQSKFIPFVVAVDKHGSAVAAGIAERASAVDPRVVRALIGRFITDLRGVISDQQAEKDAIDRVYSMLPSGAASTTIISEQFKTNSPFARAATETISVEVESILPISDKSWQVDFRETARSPNGLLLSKKRYRATLTTELSPVTNEQLIRLNPIGLFVTDISITQIL